MNQKQRKCRHCGEPLIDKFVDLGISPLANNYLSAEQNSAGEMHYPLCTYVCSRCKLVQLEEFESPTEIFSDYAYYSSYSQSWLEHAKAYTQQMIDQGYLKANDFVAEVASNDGYLLKNLVDKGYRVLGIEPAQNIAAEANDKGIPTIAEFFGLNVAQKLIQQYGQVDLLIGNNVLAHVPDINDFVQGLKAFLAPGGVITMEFPHLLQLMEKKQFDTIYHEHFSYLSVLAVQRIFSTYGLTLFKIEKLPTHGGSLRIYAKHEANNAITQDNSVQAILAEEHAFGLNQVQTYTAFHQQVQAIKLKILKTLIELKEQGHTIVGYGAPAKGNTLLNYCGIGTEFLDYTVDRNPHKQEKYLPGSRLPIYPVEQIIKDQPDYILILPWNLKYEIIDQMQMVRTWGGRFITLIPEISIE